MKTNNFKLGDLFKNFTHKTTFIMMVIVLIIGLGAKSAKASDNGEIKLEVKDDQGYPTMEAIVTLLNGKDVISQKKPDMTNMVFFKELIPGSYEVKVVLTGKFPQVLKPVIVSANKTTYLEVLLITDAKQLGTITFIEPKRSMVQETMSSGIAITSDQIKNSAMPKGDIVALIVGFTPGILPNAKGNDFHSRGAREGTNGMIIDGEKVIGSNNVPSTSIQGMTVFTGGVPAAYGDFTGGLVQITTKSFFNGIQQKKDMYEDIQTHLDEKAQYEAEQKKKIVEKKVVK